jgi:hypothetical protein
MAPDEETVSERSKVLKKSWYRFKQLEITNVLIEEWSVTENFIAKIGEYDYIFMYPLNYIAPNDFLRVGWSNLADFLIRMCKLFEEGREKWGRWGDMNIQEFFEKNFPLLMKLLDNNSIKTLEEILNLTEQDFLWLFKRYFYGFTRSEENIVFSYLEKGKIDFKKVRKIAEYTREKSSFFVLIYSRGYDMRHVMSRVVRCARLFGALMNAVGSDNIADIMQSVLSEGEYPGATIHFEPDKKAVAFVRAFVKAKKEGIDARVLADALKALKTRSCFLYHKRKKSFYDSVIRIVKVQNDERYNHFEHLSEYCKNREEVDEKSLESFAELAEYYGGVRVLAKEVLPRFSKEKKPLHVMKDEIKAFKDSHTNTGGFYKSVIAKQIDILQPGLLIHGTFLRWTMREIANLPKQGILPARMTGKTEVYGSEFGDFSSGKNSVVVFLCLTCKKGKFAKETWKGGIYPVYFIVSPEYVDKHPENFVSDTETFISEGSFYKNFVRSKRIRVSSQTFGAEVVRADTQMLHVGQILPENIIGIVVMEDKIEGKITKIADHVAKRYPKVAVPVYNKNGRVIWP